MSDAKPTTGAGLRSYYGGNSGDKSRHWYLAADVDALLAELQAENATLWKQNKELMDEASQCDAVVAAKDAEIARLTRTNAVLDAELNRCQNELPRDSTYWDEWTGAGTLDEVASRLQTLAEIGRLAVEWVNAMNKRLDFVDARRYALEVAAEDYRAAQPKQDGETK